MRSVRPAADRIIRYFLDRRPDADPSEAALFVRMSLYTMVYAGALAAYVIGFFVVGRSLLGFIMLGSTVVALPAAMLGRSARTVAGMRRGASVSMAAGTVGMVAIAAVSGELGENAAWYLVLIVVAAVFLLSERAALVWTVGVVLLLWLIPEIRGPGPGSPAYLLRSWEMPYVQGALAVFIGFFGLATRRATSAHVDTLAAHDAEMRRQNERLTRLLQEHSRTQTELITAHDRVRDALAAAERAREVTEEARRLAEDANLAKSRFLANMSHELRTPLNAVIGYSELIAEDAEAGGHEELVPDLLRIRSAGRHLLRLINELLDLAKIEAGRLDLHLENVVVADLLHDVADSVRPLAAAHGNTLVVHSSSRIGTVWSDATRLRQVLANLLSNACKFTEMGEVELRAERKGASIEVTVRDTGIGMSEAQMRDMFEPFRQADPSTTRRYGGTGLGLALARTYCELLGGTITVDSEQNVGTTFVVRLPLEARPRSLEITPEAQEEAKARPTAVSGDEASEFRVIAIDDDPAVREIVCRHLEREGCYVMTAATGEAGMALVREHRPDVVLLDVKLPRMDGWSVLANLKSHPETRDIPVIMLTVIDDPEVAFALGASEFLRKPVERTALVETMRRFGAPAAKVSDARP